MKFKIKELEELMEKIEVLRVLFNDSPGTAEENIMYQNEMRYRRFLDVVLCIIVGKGDNMLPTLDSHYNEFYGEPLEIDEFHQNIYEKEFRKLHWHLDIVEFNDGLKEEEAGRELFTLIKSISYNLDYLYFQDMLQYPFMFIQIENQMIVKHEQFANHKAEITKYLHFMEGFQDCAIGSHLQIDDEGIKICLIVPIEFETCGCCYYSMNMYYCTPVALIAAMIIDEKSKNW